MRTAVRQLGPDKDRERRVTARIARDSGGYPASVNEVREPYLGLPSSTVELIRRDEVRVLVDWVRVTKP